MMTGNAVAAGWTRLLRRIVILACLAAAPWASAQTASAPEPPLSPAQVALFAAPHLDNVTSPTTLSYRYRHEGPDAYEDRVLVRVQDIHPDGSKFVSFDFLTGPRHVFFPALDHFHGNPLLMLFLEHDVRMMKQGSEIAAAYFRNRIRRAFVDRAEISEGSTELDNGTNVPARRITLRPFADDPRFAEIPALRDKTYVFVLADRVPGMIAELRAEVPADKTAGAPALVERTVFQAATPIGRAQ